MGFEPMPPKREELKSPALDPSATQAFKKLQPMGFEPMPLNRDYDLNVAP